MSFFGDGRGLFHGEAITTSSANRVLNQIDPPE
jgi:hypothetical protein